MTSSAPVFGKRQAAVQASPGPSAAPVSDPAAFFAAARAEIEEERSDGTSYVVPRSLKAAFLASLVVGCGLAGLNIAEPSGSSPFTAIATALGAPPEVLGTRGVSPALVLIGLLSGGRVGALTVVFIHTGLARLGRTGHAAYALGAAAAAAAMSGALFVVTGEPPAHGWVIELLAGAAAGFLYRVFAGRQSI
jgi:hypothetical protein